MKFMDICKRCLDAAPAGARWAASAQRGVLLEGANHKGESSRWAVYISAQKTLDMINVSSSKIFKKHFSVKWKMNWKTAVPLFYFTQQTAQSIFTIYFCSWIQSKNKVFKVIFFLLTWVVITSSVCHGFYTTVESFLCTEFGCAVRSALLAEFQAHLSFLLLFFKYGIPFFEASMPEASEHGLLLTL